MATVKQTKEIWGKIDSAFIKLGDLLNHAHNVGVIKYDSDKYREEGPCYSFWEAYSRFKETTEASLAEAMRAEIREEHRRKIK